MRSIDKAGRIPSRFHSKTLLPLRNSQQTMEDTDPRIDRLRELVNEDLDEEFDRRANQALDDSNHEEYAALIYEYNGTPGLLNYLFREISELEDSINSLENVEAIADYGIDPEQHRERTLRDIREDYLESVQAALLSLAEQKVPELQEGEPVDGHQALLSPKERNILRTGEEGKTHTEARIRRRIRERFSSDVELLKEQSPEIYEDLREVVLEDIQRESKPDNFSPGDQVRVEGGEVGVVESVRVSSGGTVTLQLQSGSEVKSDRVIEVL